MNKEYQYGEWNPESWDLEFCKEMITFLQYDLDNPPKSRKILEVTAKMRGITVDEHLRLRNLDLINKISDLKKRIAQSP